MTWAAKPVSLTSHGGLSLELLLVNILGHFGGEHRFHLVGIEILNLRFEFTCKRNYLP